MVALHYRDSYSIVIAAFDSLLSKWAATFILRCSPAMEGTESKAATERVDAGSRANRCSRSYAFLAGLFEPLRTGPR